MDKFKNILFAFLKVAIPVGLGIYVIWQFQSEMTEEQKGQMIWAFKNANYWWILLALFGGWLSHMSRAYRWSFMLEPLGYKPRFWNNYHAVMIGYLANLAFPRLGEATRCGVMVKYEKIPFSKSFGTVIAERAADLFIMLTLTALAFVLEFDIVKKTTVYKNTMLKLEGLDPVLWGGIAIAVLILGYVGYRFARKLPFFEKILNFINGLKDGLLAILRMKKKWAFIAHTIFIWSMYYFMLFECKYSLEPTVDLTAKALLVAMVLGGYGIIVVPGGIGVYVVIVSAVLQQYQLDAGIATGFGWIVWASQTLMLIVLGAISLILMPIYNKKNGID